MPYNPLPLDGQDGSHNRGALFTRNTRLSSPHPLATIEDLLGALLLGAVGAIAGMAVHMAATPWADVRWSQSASVGAGALALAALHLLVLAWKAFRTRHLRALERAIDEGMCARASATALAGAIARDPSILSGTEVAPGTRTRFRAAWAPSPEGLVLRSLLQEVDERRHVNRVLPPPTLDNGSGATPPPNGWTLPLHLAAPRADPARWAREHQGIEDLFFDTPFVEHGTAHQRMALHAQLRASADGTAAP